MTCSRFSGHQWSFEGRGLRPWRFVGFKPQTVFGIDDRHCIFGGRLAGSDIMRKTPFDDGRFSHTRTSWERCATRHAHNMPTCATMPPQRLPCLMVQTQHCQACNHEHAIKCFQPNRHNENLTEYRRTHRSFSNCHRRSSTLALRVLQGLIPRLSP